jgi:hypothetical protein
VAKLVDAPSSGGGVRKDVLVRIQSRAPSKISNALIVLTFGVFLFLQVDKNTFRMIVRFSTLQFFFFQFIERYFQIVLSVKINSVQRLRKQKFW